MIMNLAAHKYSYRKSVQKDLNGRLSTDKNLEVAVYLKASKSARGWYSYWQSVVVEAMLGGASLQTEVQLMATRSNGYGGFDVTGAAKRSVETVLKVLVQMGVPMSRITDLGVVEE